MSTTNRTIKVLLDSVNIAKKNYIQMRNMQNKTCKTNDAIIAPLPFFRLTSSKPFDHSAIDVAGPFVSIYQRTPKEREMFKRWMLVVCCATVGCVHLEMLDKMDTSSFLLAVEQFLTVRPRPSVFLADNGTNFKGGETLLEGKNQIDISEAPKKLNIEFRFAPPRAPHFMGLVERIVGVAKAALKPALRTTAVSGEEL
jgi:hypothetical protein